MTETDNSDIFTSLHRKQETDEAIQSLTYTCMYHVHKKPVLVTPLSAIAIITH